MGFECLNCSFCWVPFVHVSVDQLAVKIFCSYAGHECIGDFIVKSVQNWFDSCICESFVACITSLDQMVCSSAFDWFTKNDIGIIVTECENMTVAFVAAPWKHAREVCACQSFEFFKFKCIDCDLVASVNAGSRWVWWLLLGEDWIWWCPCGSCSLSGSLDPAHDRRD